MSHINDGEDTGPPLAPLPAAGNTQIRARSVSLQESGRFGDGYLSGKSIRTRGRFTRGGLALKLSLPIVVALVVGAAALVVIIRHRVFSAQMTAMRNNAASVAYTNGVIGRYIIESRAAFLESYPEYRSRGEWRTGGHWAVANGFVEPERWEAATGFSLNELAPTAALDKAAERLVLGDFDTWLQSGNSEILGVYLLDNRGSVVAGNRVAAHHLDPAAYKTPPPAGKPLEVGAYRTFVDYFPELGPEPVIRGLTRIFSMREPDRQLGSAVVVLSTRRLSEEQDSILLLSLLLLLPFAAFAFLICWYSAHRVTGAIRRLASDMQAMAEGDFTRRSEVVASDETGILAQAFNSMAERLRVARANEKENSRLESDLAIARGIQNNLLPPQTPHVRGLDIHTAYRPAREIGGDYYDFLPVDSQHMGIVVADASGKSIPAALVMSTTRAILRFVAPGNGSAAETLTRINAILSVDIPKGMFVTAYYLILDPLDGTMICASAGHTPLLIARKDGSVELMNPGGIALGFDNGPIFQRSIREQRVKLERGDRALLYTDGVVECVNSSNEEYSDRRLREFLRRNRDLSSHDFVGALLADLDRHRGAAEIRDDTTIVTFKSL